LDREGAAVSETSCGLLGFVGVGDNLEWVGGDDEFAIGRRRDVVRVGNF